MGFADFFRLQRPISDHQDDCTDRKLEAYAWKHGLTAYSASRIFYLNESLNIPFLILDRNRGAYLFDVATWRPEMLRSIKAQSAHRGSTTPRAVSVDASHRLVLRKLDQTLKRDCCPVCNFLYLPHITREAFKSLDPSFHTLIPRSKVIFADDEAAQIRTKLSHALPLLESAFDIPTVNAALFIQYAVHPDTGDSGFKQPSPPQKTYIDAPLPKASHLHGTHGSGKSTSILLKAIRHRLYRPDDTVLIIQPTLAAAEMMGQRLFKAIEFAVVHIDPTSIRITTPQQISREHYVKVHKKPPIVDGNITRKMLNKPLQLADHVFIDDAHLIDERYLDYIRHLQKNRGLHTASSEQDISGADSRHTLNHSFRSPYSHRRFFKDGGMPADTDALSFLRGNAYIVTLHLLQSLLQTHTPNELLVIAPDAGFAKRLHEEITDFIGGTPTLLDPYKTLLNQDMEQLLVVPMNGLSGLQRRQVIVICDGQTDDRTLHHAIGRASDKAVVIYHTSER